MDRKHGVNGAGRATAALAATFCLCSCGSDAGLGGLGSDKARRVESGFWSSVVALPAEGNNSVLLPNGKVMLWGISGHPWGETPVTSIVIWDPTTGRIAEVPHPDGGATSWNGPGSEWLHYAGHAQLANGNILIAGGEGREESEGTTGTYEFDWRTETLTRVADMTYPRFGPTLTTLPDGRILAHAGWMRRDWDAFDAGDTGVGYTAPVAEVWDGESWSEIGEANTEAGFTPSQFIAPDGRLFRAGLAPLSDWFDLGAGIYVAGPDPVNFVGSSGVMYEEGKILFAAGGSEQLTSATYIIDLNQASPRWSRAGGMTHPRKHHHTVLLPDGTVFGVGGTTASTFLGQYDEHVLIPELWDPATDTWTALAPHAEPRAVFSTALLLFDGRVAVMGGGYKFGANPNAFNETHQHDAEIYSPGYMAGDRPTVTSTPATVVHGEEFFVGTPDAASIANVRWIRLGSSMRRFNMGQLVNNLSFASASDGLIVSAPASPTLTPPGYWVLYIIDSSGAPSVGRPIQVLTETGYLSRSR